MNEVKDFYSKIKFPGLYTIEDLEFYDDFLFNPYLKRFNDSVKDCCTVLDLGCGSGFIVNFLARRHPTIQFTALDFSDSIDYAQEFSKKNNIKNIKYIKEDILKWTPYFKYDLVICNGVLHHIFDYNKALAKIKQVSTQKVVVGLYNPYGKLAKRFFKISYKNETLYKDQEECPFEVSFSDSEVREMFKEYNLINVYPSLNNKLVDIYGLFNYNNGGLTVYTWIL